MNKLRAFFNNLTNQVIQIKPPRSHLIQSFGNMVMHFLYSIPLHILWLSNLLYKAFATLRTLNYDVYIDVLGIRQYMDYIIS